MDHKQNGYGRQQRSGQPGNDGRQHQRFSWQSPPDTPPEDETPVYQQPQQQQQQQQPAPVNTNVDTRSRAYSYAQTPIEHRAPPYTPNEQPPLPQSPPTPIDLRPQSVYSPHTLNTQAQAQQELPAPAYTEKAPFSPLITQQPAQPGPRSPVSPIQPSQAYPQQPSYHSRQRSNLSPINTNLAQRTMPPVPATPHSLKTPASALTHKTPVTPTSAVTLKKDPFDYTSPRTPNVRKSKSFATEPYSPHGFSTTPTHAVFSPLSAHGPNGLDFAAHQPGQIAHPNMDLSTKGSAHEWKHSLCECTGDISTCSTGLFCPCLLYGRTSYRLTQRSEKKDPTDMLGYSATNGHCMLMSISCGLWWLFPMVQRTRIRHAYKLNGGLVGDLLRGCCCCCCVAVQNEREVREREESARRWAGPASTEVYTAPGQMVYSPQR